MICIGVTIENNFNGLVCNPAVSNTEDSIVTEQTKPSYYQKNRDVVKEQSRTYYQKNKDKARKTKAAYKLKNKDKIKEYNIAYRLLHADRTKERYKQNWPKYRTKRRLSLYNLTPEAYTELYNKQRGLCAICNKENLKKGKAAELCVDHCHTTGKVRGLLCHTCNQMLGLSHDDVGVLGNAIKYLNDTK